MKSDDNIYLIQPVNPLSHKKRNKLITLENKSMARHAPSPRITEKPEQDVSQSRENLGITLRPGLSLADEPFVVVTRRKVFYLFIIKGRNNKLEFRQSRLV